MVGNNNDQTNEISPEVRQPKLALVGREKYCLTEHADVPPCKKPSTQKSTFRLSLAKQKSIPEDRF